MESGKLLELIEQRGISYQKYVEEWIEYLADGNPDLMDDKSKTNFNNSKLNRQRSTRIERQYEPCEELKTSISNINEPQTWVMITEDWCGDSGQNIPYIIKMASENRYIKIKIIKRDKNPEIMDRFLTDGKRCIPIVAALDESGKEVFRWGSRPTEAIELMDELSEAGLEKKEKMEKLHLWYTKNKGKSLESDFLKLLAAVEV